MSTRHLGWAICALAVLAVVAGCPKPSQRGPEEYVMIGISTGVEYWNANKAGLDDVCAELGVKPTFTGPQDQNPEAQANTMDQIIARKPAGILIAPGNPETLKPYINKAMDAGIPVICLDTDAPDSNRIAYFGTSNYDAGCMGANLLAKALGVKKGEKTGKVRKVVISSRPGQWNLDERVRGYEETFTRDYPDIKVLQVIDDETKYSVGEQKASAVLAAHPDIAGFAGVNAASGPGVAAAVKAAGKAGKIPIVAMDADSPLLDLIDDGVITYIGVIYLYGLNHGYFRKPGDTTKPDLPEIPNLIDTGTVEVNKDNVSIFRTPSQGAKEELATKHPEWVKLLSDVKKPAALK
jgi:ribose transport system substrate-binding protein